MVTGRHIQISQFGRYIFVVSAMCAIVSGYSCTNHAITTKNHFQSNWATVDTFQMSQEDIKKDPFSIYRWRETFSIMKSGYPDIKKLRNYIGKLGLTKQVSELNDLLYGEMKNATIYKKLDIEEYRKSKMDTILSLGRFYYDSTEDKDRIERYLIDFALMGITAKKVHDVYNKYQFNIFRNVPFVTQTMYREPLYKETYCSSIIVGEFEDARSDLSPKDGFRSSIVIKVHSVLKGSINSDKIIIRSYSGNDSDTTVTFYTHTEDDFTCKMGLRQIFYLSHEIYLSEIYAPDGKSFRKSIDTIAKIDRKNYYKCMFNPTIIPDSIQTSDDENVKKCKAVAIMLK